MPTYARSSAGRAIQQCELFSNVVEVRLSYESIAAEDGELEIDQRLHPLAVVLSQGCDLDWDFRARTATDPVEQQRLANKIMPNILFCELWYAADLRGQQKIQSDLWRRILNNADERYHILPACPAELDAAGTGLPQLAIDFKRVFTIPTEELYHRIGRGVQRRSAQHGERDCN